MAESSQGLVPEPGKVETRVAVTPLEFSPEGFDEYAKATDSYTAALEEASRVIAKHKRAASIAPFHVQLAIDALDGGHGGRIERVREIGILLIGAGLGYLSIMISSSSYTPKNFLLTFIPLILGFAAYAYSWGRAG
jgi:hypothetical protein